jgi:hypothetical protein
MNPIMEATLNTPPGKVNPRDTADERERQIHHDQERVTRPAKREDQEHEDTRDDASNRGWHCPRQLANDTVAGRAACSPVARRQPFFRYRDIPRTT